MKWRLAGLAGLVLLLAALGSCSMFAPYLASNREFAGVTANGAIAFEAGAQALALELAAALPAALEQVERAQGAPFKQRPPVYICATAACYQRHTGQSQAVRGSQVGSAVYLSPRLVREPQTARGILVHELSHVHLFQYRGWRYHQVPHWFQEGLAVVVAGGAGAEDCTEQQAATLIRAGKHIDPVEPGGLFAFRNHLAYGLQPHEFYRQAALFVGWMRSHDGKAFLHLLQQLRDGHVLGESFARAYGFSIEEGWRRMLPTLPPV